MIVRPELMSARSAPSTNPLNICETRLAQVNTTSLANPTHGDQIRGAGSGVVAEPAAERVGLLHQGLAGHDLDDVVEVLLVLHVCRLLAADDDDRPHQLVIVGAEI